MENQLVAAVASPIAAPAVDAVDRFGKIYQALEPGSRWWNDSAWLRFSAQAAVMGTEGPVETARAIEAAAAILYRNAHWYDALASPLNLVVAATLVQTSDTADAFTADVASGSRLLHLAGFRLGGSLLIKTILTMRVLAGGANASAQVADRMHQIYVQLKGNHWWMTGQGDAPSCALLASIAGTPPEISSAVEDIYKRLHGRQLRAGRELLTAAHLLLLRGLPGTRATDRFIAIIDLLIGKSAAIFNSDYLGIALLSLLDHEPVLVVERLGKMMEALTDLPPLQFSDVNSSIAADLAFLDLAAVDAQLHPIGRLEDLEPVKKLIRIQLAASLLLVQVPSIAAVEGGSTRWQA